MTAFWSAIRSETKLVCPHCGTVVSSFRHDGHRSTLAPCSHVIDTDDMEHYLEGDDFFNPTVLQGGDTLDGEIAHCLGHARHWKRVAELAAADQLACDCGLPDCVILWPPSSFQRLAQWWADSAFALLAAEELS